jgi:hypothetical protein
LRTEGTGPKLVIDARVVIVCVFRMMAQQNAGREVAAFLRLFAQPRTLDLSFGSMVLSFVQAGLDDYRAQIAAAAAAGAAADADTGTMPSLPLPAPDAVISYLRASVLHSWRQDCRLAD